MWDAKRQFIWLAAGLALGTFVAFSDAHDEDGIFVAALFFLHGKPGADNYRFAVLHLFAKEAKVANSRQ